MLVQVHPLRLQLVASLVGVLVGWIVAVPLIPAINYYDQGALTAAGMALALGLMSGGLFAGLSSPISAFRTEHLLMLGLVYWVLLDGIQGAYWFGSVSRYGIVTAFNGVAIFAACLYIGSLAVSGIGTSAKRDGRGDVGARFLFNAAAICFVLGMLRIVITCNLSPACIADAFFIPRWHAKWFTADVGNWDTVLNNLRYFGYLTLPLTVALHHVERRVSWRVIVAGLLTLIFLLVLIRDGARREVGTACGAAALLWILLHPRIRLRHIAFAAIIAVGLLYILQAMLAWRDVGVGTGFKEGREISYTSRQGISVDTNLLLVAFIADTVPSLHPHTGTKGLWYVATYPLPRSIVPSKPVGRGFNLPAYRGMRVPPGYSWTASAIGDLYLMGGYVAIVVGGIVFGVLANFCSRLMSRRDVQGCLIYGIAAMTLFICLRALHEVLATGLAVVALWGLLVLRKALLKKRYEALPPHPSPSP